MAEQLSPDICVIGGGPGGVAAALAAAAEGVSVVLVEKGRLGGTNLVSGAVPSKALLAAAEVYEALRAGPALGITGAPLQVNFGKVRDHIVAATEAIARNVSLERLTVAGIKVIAGEARFANPGMVVVGETAITARRFVLAVGSVPNTVGLGLEETGVVLGPGGFVEVDRVSRTAIRGVYAAGDCTGVLMLASVAAMQGRIAMWHALGDAVHPLDLKTVASNVFTDPEIATVGVTQADVDRGDVVAVSVKLPLATNARAKMQGLTDGFVKLFALPGNRTLVGGVVVAPRASELVFPVAVAIEQRLTVDELAHTFTVYPSLSGSIAEAAAQLHAPST